MPNILIFSGRKIEDLTISQHHLGLSEQPSMLIVRINLAQIITQIWIK